MNSVLWRTIRNGICFVGLYYMVEDLATRQQFDALVRPVVVGAAFAVVMYFLSRRKASQPT